MKLIKILASVSLLISVGTFARTDCPAEKVTNIQIEGSTILYSQVGSSWRRLGTLSEAGTKERYSALLAAQMSGRKVMVAYADDNYDCSKANYSDSAYIVRTYNK
jgi:hypothetical protein